ncbi:MAG: sugar phosphate isomerase/epimerase [Gemmatimonadetes bacterium]|nr:sugar phosphate isomerase/epimerase [Gemmatimonadota bacterium]
MDPMIKLGCTAMLRDEENPGQFIDVESLIDLIHDLRLDIVDLHLYRGFRSRSFEYLRQIKRKCLRYGLPIGYVGTGDGFVGAATGADQRVVGVSLPPEELRRRVAEAKEAVDVAAFMGAPLVRLFGGGLPEGTEDREALWSSMIRSFQEVADYAIDKGIFLGLHNHPPAVAPTGDDILRILHDTDRENFTFILDTGQWFGSPGSNLAGKFDPGLAFYRYMEQTAPYATCVRAKIYKIDSGQEEWLDYERIVPILKAVNYNGNVSIIFEDRNNRCNYAEAIGLAARYLRGLLAD